MTAPDRGDVRRFLITEVAARLTSQGRKIEPAEISDDTDLLLGGFIDSFGLLELAAALGDFCGVELDFSELDPDELTIVGPLCDFAAAQAAGQS